MFGDDRAKWANTLRCVFSPPDMLFIDGSIDQSYFLTSNSKILTHETLENITWSVPETNALLLGIEKHGVGEWTNIIFEFLPNWDPKELKTQTCLLFGMNLILTIRVE